ncbi:MAG: methyltransferase domain-containing protein [Elusimicrobia bacterium]|nr:methyltransferase domain-containing protein [Elusimicrobiota bacterium]
MKRSRNRTCRMCDGRTFDTVADLGKHPLVNSLVAKKDLAKKDPVFPLVVKQCRKCGLVQLVDIIHAEEIYKNVDYLYFSSDMPGLDKYFAPYAQDVKDRFIQNPSDLVVEIGSNDGILLNLLKDGARVLGVDPATNVALRALKRGIPTVPLFFSERLAGQIRNEWGQAKAVIGNNCIAHLNDLHDLIRGVDLLLAADGVFIIECNYWGGMVKNTNYSLIYHDHYSFFSVKVWRQFAARYGLTVFDAVVTPAQGGSLRMFLCKDGRPATDRLQALIKEEADTRLNAFATSVRYNRNVQASAKKLRKVVDGIKKAGKSIAGYGAAAKGFTILTCSKIGAKHIDYFVDDSPAKQGWYTPVDHIPIISRAEAEKRLPDYFIILAPNYADGIIAKEADSLFRKQGGKFIVPVGSIDIR